MTEIEEKINTENKRDYDKNPIVIEDYNPKIMYEYINKIFLLGLLVIIINPFNILWTNMIGGFIGLLIIYYPIYKRYKNLKKRLIILKEENIHVYYKNKKLYKLTIKDINLIEKTYQSFYTKEQSIQKFNGFKKLFAYILNIVLLPLKILDLLKIIFKKVFLIKNFKTAINSEIFDSLLLVTDDEIINILIPTNEIYDELNEYVKEKFFKDIKQLKKNFMFFYIDEIK